MSATCEKYERIGYIDQHVGNKIRLRRLLLGLSQETVSNAVHVSIQQIQKYEKGVNRISSGNLYKLGQVLNVQIEYFFEGIDNIGSSILECHTPIKINAKEGFTLINAYNRITCAKAKNKIIELINILSMNGRSDKCELQKL